MRRIKPELIVVIDKKLSDNGFEQKALKAIEDKDARNLLIYAAEACVGEMEHGADNHGAFVELCQRTVDNRAEGESWCMCFIQSIIGYVEEKLNVQSPIYADESCLEVWQKSPDECIVKNFPNKGAIAIWRSRNSSEKNPTTSSNPKRRFEYTGSGHTALVIEYDSDENVKTMTTIEGNTNAKGLRNGDGVFKKNNRSKTKESGTSDLEVIGFLIPFKKIEISV
jgi:hypothetical protein